MKIIKSPIITFLKLNKIKFKNYKLFEVAFTHSSYANEIREEETYQRLEFIGDSILSKHVSVWLFKNYSDLNEGKMSILRSSAVSAGQLSIFARKIKIDKYIKVGKALQNGDINDKILADVFEALIAAIYLDTGEKNVEKFLNQNVYDYIKKSINKNLKNPKTILQEKLQVGQKVTIKYEIRKRGKFFYSIVKCNNGSLGWGWGKTKKSAEVSAARNALKRMCQEDEVN